MKRALELARLGMGHVSPNPMVGCVIVHDNKIIGEGYHKRYGEAHAEVNAINDVKDHSLLKESTAYVTLEPCAHHGKTPPCADLLIEKQIEQVVIATEDPFKEVDGKGIAKLKNAGIETEVNILRKEATDLNKRFFTYHSEKRPYIILKWTQTEDGFIARSNFDSKWISNPYSRQLVHKWRSEEDAILVGKNTALYDNPTLTTRNWKGENPVRVLLDRRMEIKPEQSLFNDDSKTIIINELKHATMRTNHWVKARDMHPSSILKVLYDQRLQSVIIEGGSHVLKSFIQENCWDEARIFSSNKRFESGIKAPTVAGNLLDEASIFGDTLKIIRNHG